MKKFLKEIAIIAIVILIASNIIGYFRSYSVNSSNLINTLKNYKTIDNKSLAKLLESNKPLIINFWGTWCPICNQEVYTLSNLAKRDDIILITISVNSGSNKEIKKYMQQKGIDFLVVNDKEGKIAKLANISVFPTSIFFSPNRKKVIKDSGYTTKAGFLARVKLLKD